MKTYLGYRHVRHAHIIIAGILCFSILLVLVGCSSKEQPTPTAMVPIAPTPTITPDHQPTRAVVSTADSMASPGATESIAPMIEWNPTPTDLPTPEATATPTAVPTKAFDTTNRFSMNRAEIIAPPSYVKRQLALASGGAGFGSGCAPWVDLDAIQEEPYLLRGGSYLGYRSFAPNLYNDLPDVCACGFRAQETAQISLIDPSGVVIQEETAIPQPVLDPSFSGSIDDVATASLTYCVFVSQISSYRFVPGDPLGQYTIDVAGQSGSVQHQFSLVPPSLPFAYYAPQLEGVVLAGFDPNEDIQVVVYTAASETNRATLATVASFQMDQNGIGVVPRSELPPSNSGYVLYFIGRGSHYAVETVDLRGSTPVDGPIDLGQLLTGQSPSAAEYYLRVRYDDLSPDAKVANLNKAIELEPEQASLYLERAKFQSDDDLAIADLNRCLELAPGLTDALVERAKRYDRSELWGNALEDYATLTLIDCPSPRCSGYFKSRARINLQLKDYQQAVIDLSEAIELDMSPGPAGNYLARAAAYHFLEQYDLAILDFDKALNIDPSNADAYVARGLSRARSGNTVEAITDAQKGLELAQNDDTRQRAELLLKLLGQ